MTIGEAEEPKTGTDESEAGACLVLTRLLEFLELVPSLEFSRLVVLEFKSGVYVI